MGTSQGGTVAANHMPFSKKRLEEDRLEEKPRTKNQDLKRRASILSHRSGCPVKERASCCYNVKSETAHSAVLLSWAGMRSVTTKKAHIGIKIKKTRRSDEDVISCSWLLRMDTRFVPI